MKKGTVGKVPAAPTAPGAAAATGAAPATGAATATGAGAGAAATAIQSIQSGPPVSGGENMIVALKNIVVAILVLAVVLLILVILYIFYKWVYIRAFWFSNTETGFNEFLADFMKDIVENMNEIGSGVATETNSLSTFYNDVCFVHPISQYINEWVSFLGYVKQLPYIGGERYFDGNSDKAEEAFSKIMSATNNVLFGTTISEFTVDLLKLPALQGSSKPSLEAFKGAVDVLLKNPKYSQINDLGTVLTPQICEQYPILNNFKLKLWEATTKNIDMFFEDKPKSDRLEKLTLSLITAPATYTKLIAFETSLKSVQSSIQEIIKRLQSSYKKIFKVDLATIESATMKQLPDLYIIMLQPNLLLKKDKKGLGRMMTFFENLEAGQEIQTYIQKYFQESKNTDVKALVLQEAITDWNKILNILIELRKATEKYKKLIDGIEPIMKISEIGTDKRFNSVFYDDMRVQILELNMLLNEYWGDLKGRKNNSIVRMSMFRQSGGMFNFTLVWLYMIDYYEFCILEQVVPLWVDFGKKITGRADAIGNWMSSAAMLAFFMSLPKKFAGMDEGEGASGKDTIETFVGAIMKIGAAFVSIADVFLSIVNVITDPIAFLKFLIGWIVAILLLIVWMILALPPFLILYGFVMTMLSAWWGSILWIIIFLFFCTLYFLLSVLDIFFGGAIMRMLRCENLPNVWHTRYNWHKGNKYDRSLFCSSPCRKNFSPFAGILCVRQSNNEPAYAPHQLVYTAYKKEGFLASQRNMLFNYKFNKALYIDMTGKMKVENWKDAYTSEQEYVKKMRTKYRTYEKLVEGICSRHFQKPEKNGEMVAVCRSIFCTGDVANANMCNSKDGKGNLNEPPPLVLVFLKVCIATLVMYIVLQQYWEGNI